MASFDPGDATKHVATRPQPQHHHRLRHNHGLEFPRRFARQTMLTSTPVVAAAVAAAANMSWPVKRSVDLEGDIILGNDCVK